MKISIIIPTYNEAARIATCLEKLEHQADSDTEIIVADGCSTDATTRIVVRFRNVRLIQPQVRGRGQQMHCGAIVASGSVLLFLHADTQLPEGALRAIRHRLRDSQVRAGSFAIRFDHPHPLLRLLAWFTRWNTRWWTFGDQAIFTRRADYFQIGGYRFWPILEDFDLQWRLRRQGKFVRLPLPVCTSARRFLQRGIVRQVVQNLLIVCGYFLGVPPRRLARFYRY